MSFFSLIKSITVVVAITSTKQDKSNDLEMCYPSVLDIMVRSPKHHYSAKRLLCESEKYMKIYLEYIYILSFK